MDTEWTEVPAVQPRTQSSPNVSFSITQGRGKRGVPMGRLSLSSAALACIGVEKADGLRFRILQREGRLRLIADDDGAHPGQNLKYRVIVRLQLDGMRDCALAVTACEWRAVDSPHGPKDRLLEVDLPAGWDALQPIPPADGRTTEDMEDEEIAAAIEAVETDLAAGSIDRDTAIRQLLGLDFTAADAVEHLES